MSFYPMRLFDAWQALDPDVIEADLGALVDGLNVVARLAAYQVPRANVGLSMGLNGLRFREPLTAPWVLIRDADNVERTPVVEADAPALADLGVLRRAAAVADVALVPGNGAASQAALVTGLNALLAALVGTGGMEWINQAKPVGSPAGDTSAWALQTQALASLASTLAHDASDFNAEIVP
jgi:hypothetical protein